MAGKKKGVIQKDSYTATEVGTLIHGFSVRLKLYINQLEIMNKKLDAMYKRLYRSNERINLTVGALENKVAVLAR